jgi:hypothetical protein
LLLVNVQHLKAVPGRKTDVKDAEWIADLLRHGLLKASFVPDRELGAVSDEPDPGAKRRRPAAQGARVESLLPAHGCPSAAGQQPEALDKACGNLLDAQHT